MGIANRPPGPAADHISSKLDEMEGATRILYRELQRAQLRAEILARRYRSVSRFSLVLGASLAASILLHIWRSL